MSEDPNTHIHVEYLQERLKRIQEGHSLWMVEIESCDLYGPFDREEEMEDFVTTLAEGGMGSCVVIEYKQYKTQDRDLKKEWGERLREIYHEENG